MTQSAVSKALAEIEATVGAVLFQRSRQGIVPNQLGRLLLGRVKRVLGVLDPAAGPEAEPVLKIGYLSEQHGTVLGLAYAQWRRSGGNQLRLLEVSFAQGMQALQGAQLDALLLDEAVPGALRVFSYCMVPVLRKQHPLLMQECSLRASDVQHLEWLLPTGQPSFQRALERWLGQLGLSLPSLRMYLPAGPSLSTAVAQSDALAFLPAAQAFWFEQAGVVTSISMVDAPAINASAYLLLAAHSQRDPALQHAIEQLAQLMDGPIVCTGAS